MNLKILTLIIVLGKVFASLAREIEVNVVEITTSSLKVECNGCENRTSSIILRNDEYFFIESASLEKELDQLKSGTEYVLEFSNLDVGESLIQLDSHFPNGSNHTPKNAGLDPTNILWRGVIKTARCPQEWTGFKNSCYKRFANASGRNDASNECKTLSPNTHLANPRTMEEFEFITGSEIIPEGIGLRIYWIGITISSDGNATYSDGAPLSPEIESFRSDVKGDDSECVALNPTGAGSYEWIRAQCFVPAHYICEYPVPQAPKNIIASAEVRSSEVSWSEPTSIHGSDYSYYVSELRLRNPLSKSVSVINIPKHRGFWTYEDLKSGFDYYVSIVTEDESGGRSAKFPDALFITRPPNVEITKVSSTHNSIYIEWRNIDKSDDVIYDNFEIRLSSRSEKDPVATSTNDTNATISNLDPHTTYAIEVYTIVTYNSFYGERLQLSMYNPLAVAEISTRVSPVFNFHVNENNLYERSLVVEWLEPVGDYDGFGITISSENLFREYDTPKKSGQFSLTDLEPGTSYNISIYTVKDSVKSATVTLEQTTRPLRLTAFQAIISKNRTIDSVTFDMSRSWSGADIFDQYLIEFNRSNTGEVTAKKFDRESKQITFDGLTPGSIYTVSLYTEKNGVLSFPRVENDVMLQVAPPQNLTLIYRDETNLTLGWKAGKGVVTNFMLRCSNCFEGQKLLSAQMNNEFSVDDLTPGALYDFSVQAHIFSDQSDTHPPASERVDLSVRTLPNSPKNVRVLPYDENVNDTRILEWSKVDGVLDGYEVTYGKSNIVQFHKLAVGDRNIFINDSNASTVQLQLVDLVPGITFSGNVRTISGDVQSMPELFTFSTVPTPVHRIYIDDYQEYAVSVSLDTGLGGYTKILYSAFEASTGALVLVRDTNETQFLVDSLKPGTLYRIVVEKRGYNITSMPTTTYVQTRPLPVTDVEVYDISEMSFSVRWGSPKSPYSEFTAILHDSIAPDNEVSRKTVSVSFISFTNLLPGKKYTLELRSTINSTDSHGVFSEVTLFPLPPLGLISAGTTSNSLSVTWTRPEGLIGSYFLTWFPDEGSKNITGLEEATIAELTPGVEYSIFVYSRSEDNLRMSQDAATKTVSTHEDYPGPPSSLAVMPTSRNSVNVSWEMPEAPNGKILRYVLEYQQFYPHSTAVSATVGTDGDIFSFQISGLIPGTWYVFKIKAKNSKGSSEWSEEELVRTEEWLPGPVDDLQVSASSPRTLDVSWNVPENPNGEITKYQLQIIHIDSAEEIENITFHRDMSAYPLECAKDVDERAMMVFGEFEPQNNTVDGPFFTPSCNVSYQIGGLLPYTHYTTLVQAFTVKGRGQYASHSQITMEEAPSGPPRNITVATSAADSITVSWAPPKFPRGLLAYHINVSDGGFYSTDDTYIELTDLIPFSIYGISMMSLTSAGSSNATDWLLVNTAEDVPTAPTNLQGQVMNSKSVYLSWQSPLDPKGILVGYEISIFDESQNLFRVDSISVDNANITENTEPPLNPVTELNNNIPLENETLLQSIIGSKIIKSSNDIITHIAKDLKPFTEYRFEVVGLTNAGRGSPNTTVFKTHEDKPGSSPSNLSYVNITSTSVNLTWLEPEDPNGNIISYMVMFMSETGEMETKETNKTHIMLENLSKFSLYTIYINSKTSAGIGPTSEGLQVYTEEDQPESPPLNLQYFNVTPTVIRLKWLPPKIPNGNIKFYTVYYRNSSKEYPHRSYNTSTFLTNLKVYGEYFVKVAASTKYGDGDQESTVLYVRTGEGQPGSPPYNLTYENISPTSIQIYWKKPVEPNGVITHYEIVVSSDDAAPERHSTPTAETKYLLDGLKPDSTYQISMRVHTKYGDGGQKSDQINVTTLEDAPGSPPLDGTYQNISSSEVVLTWNKPDAPNGNITGYYIYLESEKVWQNDNMYVLDGLSPYTQYDISISATTLAGEGPNATIIVNTEEDEPGSPPRNLNYVQLSSTAIKVSWLPPLIPNGIIQSYTLQYKKVDDDDDDVKFEMTNDTSIELSELEKFSTYEAYVSAKTKHGDGNQLSKLLIFQTLQDAPSDPPRNLQLLNITSTSAELTWDQPMKPNGIIQYYTLYFKGDKENDTFTRKVFNATSAVVEGLQKYSFYNVTVTGSTGLGDGNQISKMLRIRTDPGVPEDPVNFISVRNDSTMITVNWSEPSIITGEYYYKLVLYKLVDESKLEIEEVQTDQTEYSFLDLQPFTPYLISVTPMVEDVDGFGPDIYVYANTLEDAPSAPVSNLSINVLSYDEAIISWKDSPAPNGVIVAHVIDVNDGGFQEELPAEKPYIWRLYGLKPSTTYKIAVIPVTSVGRGPAEEITITTMSGLPESHPTNIQIVDLHANNVTLLWDAPLDEKVEIINYRVTCKKLDVSVATKIYPIDVNDTEAIITGLDAFSKYSVSIQAGSMLGMGPSSDPVIFSTPEDVPTAPSYLQLSMESNTSIKVDWKEPNMPNGIITQYILSYEMSSSKKHTEYIPADKFSFVIEDVTPFTDHEIGVKAETKVGAGLLITDMISTPQGEPTAPLDFSIVSASSTSLSFKWKMPLKLNGLLRHYVIHYTPAYSCWANGGDLLNTDDGMICIVKVSGTAKTLMSLEKYSMYTVNVGAVTGGGLGEMTTPKSFRTKTGVPTYPPRYVDAHHISSTAVNVTWTPPLYFAGPTSYQAKAYVGKVLFASSRITGSEDRSVIIEDLDEDTTYSVTVLAITTAGKIESISALVSTIEDVPSGPPAELIIETSLGNTSAVSVQFLPPEDPNGGIFNYSLQYKIGEKGSVATIVIMDENLIYDKMDSLRNVTVSDLLGGRDYYFRMKAATLVGHGPWTNWTGPIVMPVSAPVKTKEAARIIVQSDSTLAVRLCAFSEEKGFISNLTVIVAEDGAPLDQSPVHWFQSYWKDPSPPYMVLASQNYNELCDEEIESARKRRSVDPDSDSFILGTDLNCEQTRKPYCNGPLKTDTPYRVKLRATTSNGDYTDTEFSEPRRTEPTFLQAHLYLLIGLIAGFIVLLIFISIVIHHCRKKLNSRSFHDSQSSRHSSLNKRLSASGVKSPSPVDNLSFVMEPTNTQNKKPITRPVKKSDFATHVLRMSEHNDRGFMSEFKEIASLTSFGSKTIGSQPYNTGKNRFIEIIPYDHYRVKIEDISSIEGSGYINASYVPGSKSPEQYIATQSPLANTINEFWRMVWETGSRTLIMLCNVEQDGIEEKISKYWPILTQTSYYGNLAVQCSLEEKKPEWTVRTFIMTKRDQRRQVTQYHFTLWPLRGVPENPQPFTRFYQATRRGVSSDGKPVIVMCSSGSGRSAVFIAYDMIMDALKDSNSVDPCGVVAELRSYRPCMIQTVAEYSFLHRCLANSIISRTATKSSMQAPTGDGFEETTMF